MQQWKDMRSIIQKNSLDLRLDQINVELRKNNQNMSSMRLGSNAKITLLPVRLHPSNQHQLRGHLRVRLRFLEMAVGDSFFVLFSCWTDHFSRNLLCPPWLQQDHKLIKSIYNLVILQVENQLNYILMLLIISFKMENQQKEEEFLLL